MGRDLGKENKEKCSIKRTSENASLSAVGHFVFYLVYTFILRFTSISSIKIISLKFSKLPWFEIFRKAIVLDIFNINNFKPPSFKKFII